MRLEFSLSNYNGVSMQKWVYMSIGGLALGLGILGIFLPVLPTTPFLLLALFCFSRSSERLHQWFVDSLFYQKYLKEFDEKRAMTMRQKFTILAIAFPFCLFAFLTTNSIWARGALILLVLFQYWYFFFRIRTIKTRQAS